MAEQQAEKNKRRRVGALGGGSQSTQRNQSRIDCPICMEACTSEGDHHICCLPCGHPFGLSCINKWLQQRGRLAKCPQCNRKCALKDVRKLFLPRNLVSDEGPQKKIRYLEEKCASLEKKAAADLCEKQSEWTRTEAALLLEIETLQQELVDGDDAAWEENQRELQCLKLMIQVL